MDDKQHGQSTRAPQPTVSKEPRPPVSGPFASLEAWLYEMLVVKAPFQLPVGLTDWIVAYGPWITLVIGILLLPVLFSVLALLGFFTVAAPIAFYGGYTAGAIVYLALAALAAEIVMTFMAIPKLLKRERSGWLLLFYVELLSIVYGIINAFGDRYAVGSGLVGTAIGAVIGCYILFQIRRYYTE